MAGDGVETAAAFFVAGFPGKGGLTPAVFGEGDLAAFFGGAVTGGDDLAAFFGGKASGSGGDDLAAFFGGAPSDSGLDRLDLAAAAVFGNASLGAYRGWGAQAYSRYPAPPPTAFRNCCSGFRQNPGR
jgi:hypothetical protein